MKIRATREYVSKYPLDIFNISKEFDCTVIPVKGMMFTDVGLVKEGVIESVEIVKVEISPSEDKYYITLKQDEQHYSRDELEQKFKNMTADSWEYLEEQFLRF
ncbi:hypothetical protein R4473_00250 [Acinetobacter baumannii]|uniref:hypothetical protein n=1 Tax=Acinetobacter calcoaceticus/baumannii complex TaxID=909768 RepID=UPI001021A897|nr:hypothetical protein [Acinetobacter baumannii]MCC8263157.1 hypothetical protein [Acinetobacter baumannii]MCC8271596.1 hypothetical protein [Acinetobacter baumannii]MCC8297219.1 hypothetical protein [Acinetobacter baumannii]MCC8320975.1 hypothetical protein [Acinetobacter baumannii]MCC8325577.1 hypothetical protein [Acinetobacter baumannii]